MRELGRQIERDGSGSVRLQADDLEDIWHIYNLISKGDRVQGSTVRRVQSESNTGSTDSQRLRITLTIAVETVDPDLQLGILRINGRNVEENKYVKTGSYHTLDLEQNKPFTLTKQEWDILDMERIDAAVKAIQKAQVGAVVLQEGLAHICLLTETLTKCVQRIEMPVLRKRLGSVTQYEKGMTRFLDQVYQSMCRQIPLDTIQCVLVASPGFYAEAFMKHALAQATKSENRAFLSAKQKFILAHCSSGHIGSLKEVLAEPSVQNLMSNTRYAKETKALNDFYGMLGQDADRAFYGYAHVRAAADRQAVGTLLLSDGLFRSVDVATRRQYIQLVQDVRNTGGTVHIFSAAHMTGEQLGQLSGVAAILTFPLPELELEMPTTEVVPLPSMIGVVPEESQET